MNGRRSNSRILIVESVLHSFFRDKLDESHILRGCSEHKHTEGPQYTVRRPNIFDNLLKGSAVSCKLLYLLRDVIDPKLMLRKCLLKEVYVL